MGAPISLSRKAQAPSGLAHWAEIVKVLDHFKFEETQGFAPHAKGTCWSVWPHHTLELADDQIVTNVAPALAAGCTMVLKPGEMAPLCAYLFAQILHEAAVPSGVLNLVNGDGPTVGAAIASHPDVAMVSFTGSTQAGVAVAAAAAATVKRVTQELGGKMGQHSSGRCRLRKSSAAGRARMLP
jgi:aldehyde dehydrogenase (NAD+)